MLVPGKVKPGAAKGPYLIHVLRTGVRFNCQKDRKESKQKYANFSENFFKAKQEGKFRFYILYDKIHRWDILLLSRYRVKKNNGSPGIDGQTFRDMERMGIRTFLKEIQKELKDRTDKPQAVLRCRIEKANGKLRPLGIPTIRDRVVQMACKIRQPGNKKNAKVLKELNPVLTGRRNYYNAPGSYPRKVFRDINRYLRQRISGFYRRKGQRRSKLYGRRAYEHLIKSGLVVM